MSTLRRFSFALTGIVILSLLLVLSMADQERAVGAPAASNVVVVNTTANPVPTAPQGTTPISGNVGITGTPNVNVTNTPTVTLAPGASVRDADNPARQPIAFNNGVSLLDGHESGQANLGTVPLGKRMVIELATASLEVPIGQK